MSAQHYTARRLEPTRSTNIDLVYRQRTCLLVTTHVIKLERMLTSNQGVLERKRRR